MLANEHGPIEIKQVVIEKPRVAARFRHGSADLAGCALPCDHEKPAAWSQQEPLKALIVRAAAFRIRRLGWDGARTGIVGREIVSALALGDESLRRTDCRNQTAGCRKAIDIRSVFIADEETAVR